MACANATAPKTGPELHHLSAFVHLQALQKAPGGGGVAAAIDHIWPQTTASSTAQVHAARASWLQRWESMVETVWAPRSSHGRPSSSGAPHRKRSAEEEHRGLARERKHASGPAPGSKAGGAEGRGAARKGHGGKPRDKTVARKGNMFDALMGGDGDG